MAFEHVVKGTHRIMYDTLVRSSVLLIVVVVASSLMVPSEQLHQHQTDNDKGTHSNELLYINVSLNHNNERPSSPKPSPGSPRSRGGGRRPHRGDGIYPSAGRRRHTLYSSVDRTERRAKRVSSGKINDKP